jgi:16S rRNA G966 N2-methylase RsmD
MAKGNIVSPQKFDKMSKKQKQTVKKDTFSLGFDPGFTKKLIDSLYRAQSLQKAKGKKKIKLSVIEPEEKKSKKIKTKKIDEKTKKLKHRLKKKSKKSVWD